MTNTARAKQKEKNVVYDNVQRQRIRWHQQGEGHPLKKALVLQFNTDMESFVFTINCILVMYIYSNGNKGWLSLYYWNLTRWSFSLCSFYFKLHASKSPQIIRLPTSFSQQIYVLACRICSFSSILFQDRFHS